MSRSLRWPIGLTAVLAVALVARLAAAVAVDRIVSQTPGRLCLIEGDAEGYWLLAGHLVRGERYEVYDPPRRILRMPGLPVILAGCRLVFGDVLWPTRCVLAVLGAIGCGCVYWLGCELEQPTAGLIAATATALSPALVVFSPLLLSESSFATAMAASLIPLAMLLKDRGGGNPRFLVCVSAGVLCAVATYLRPTWLPVVILAALAAVMVRRF